MATTRRTLHTLLLATALAASPAACGNTPTQNVTADRSQPGSTTTSPRPTTTSTAATPDTSTTTTPRDTTTTEPTKPPGHEICPDLATITGLAQKALTAYASGNTTELRTAIDNAHQAAQNLLDTPNLPPDTNLHLKIYDATITAALQQIPADKTSGPATSRTLDNLKTLFESDTLVQIAVTKAAICETTPVTGGAPDTPVTGPTTTTTSTP